MLDVTIDRKTWYRGQGDAHSMLLLHNGKRCCIGFLCQAMGIPDEQLLELKTMEVVDGPRAAHFHASHNSTLIEAYMTNDEIKTREIDREIDIVRIGKLMDVNFTFIN